ncbi:cytochrome C oxidase subunit IV family protein [Mycolicibacterium smegmatis]|uniref:cytochrome C oxidase subunit IV family protein n=1 Tax=Mycolicibacterium smegmatis TaxID=1772 RepID=UPI0005D89A39|nr:cytochrome C oxidase subunit IV family protein [Mycolicibacterium smegmatis]MCP2621692.1 cytochrome C oxidase subunit IV family protein [Mycolicibacterium smegmatis]MDF1901487.1 cytochrome C oxidase subunit IV family protein [Mycolicibacterium smegmatis]MDF1907750.1 cytochrome C oxidase subunit IV family protein [Mycolicibacterium smegmatis]MDF1918080.1 cytochrome C oxidase subunit IV family protein [Mycolicibacterium smegmatis]MDF1926010.1 cytochrome C oxidase subunit IV family protein [My
MATRPTTSGESTRSITWVWLALTAITIGSWWLAPAHITGTVQASTTITAVVLVLTFVKCRLIIRHFMEVRTAPRWLGHATDAWLVVLLTTVFVIYLF